MLLFQKCKPSNFCQLFHRVELLGSFRKLWVLAKSGPADQTNKQKKNNKEANKQNTKPKPKMNPTSLQQAKLYGVWLLKVWEWNLIGSACN